MQNKMKAYEILQMAKRSHFNKTYRYKTRDDGNGAVATTADRKAMVAVCDVERENLFVFKQQQLLR